MNAVEIEEAVSALAERPFDPEDFPFAFLEAFGNKETPLKRLRRGESNKSDLGGVFQTNNIHIAVAAPGEVTKTLSALKASPATTRAKAGAPPSPCPTRANLAPFPWVGFERSKFPKTRPPRPSPYRWRMGSWGLADDRPGPPLPELRNARPAKASEWPASAGRGAKTVSWVRDQQPNL